MDINEHTTPDKLERYAFEWSLLRLIIAALSLFFGAVPFAYRLFDSSNIYSLLLLFWIISGVASAYLLYLWYKSDWKVFGKTDQKTRILFGVLVVSGINLGLTGLIGNNIGMGLASGEGLSDILFKVTALIYAYTAYTLWNGWKANGRKLFSAEEAAEEVTTEHRELEEKPEQD